LCTYQFHMYLGFNRKQRHNVYTDYKGLSETLAPLKDSVERK